jgi:hypothetical protein
VVGDILYLLHHATPGDGIVIATIAHPSPDRERVGLTALVFAMSAAPLAWAVQLLAGYAITAQACYPGDHPVRIPATALYRTLILVIDAAAILVALAGAIVAFSTWRRTCAASAGTPWYTLDIAEDRTNFMSLWGILSSVCFLAAIVFATIGSLTVPLCTP